MSDKLPAVDLSVLDSLVDLKRERETMKQRLARLGDAGAHVSEEVMQRVRKDYQARLRDVEGKAAKLKETARASYLELKPLQANAEKVFENFRLEEEEIQLRHELGELSVAKFESRVAELDENREQAETQQAELSELVARFVDAFDSPEDLEPPQATPGVSTGKLSVPAPTPAPQDDDHTVVTPPTPPPPAEPATPPPPAPALSLPSPPSPPSPPDTVEASVFPAAEPVASGKLDAPAGDAPTTPAQGAGQPRLEALDEEIEPRFFVLEPLTFVGRTPENQVRIYKPAVSRRHAQIAESPGGWMLRDLSSENGTYVNGQRVTERTLVDGDRVQFGTSRFVFKTA